MGSGCSCCCDKGQLEHGHSNAPPSHGVKVMVVKTEAYSGQKTGTSGLRKKTKEFRKPHYLENWVQSLFNALSAKGQPVHNQTLVLGGDGRCFNLEAAQRIIKVCAANGVRRVIVGQHAYLCTPAASCLIRHRKAHGGFIMTASHNPGGENEDWGIKYNSYNGEPAPEKITNEVFKQTSVIKEYRIGDMPDVDLNHLGPRHPAPGFEVEVVSCYTEYVQLLRNVFDIPLLQTLCRRRDFHLKFDGMHAITGVYAKPILCDLLGAPLDSLRNCQPKEDFGGGHPDPNLEYAQDLVKLMSDGRNAPHFGAASDGDGDRNMILGRGFFVTPCDSVAIIAHYAQECIPYFRGGLKGVARSMPTSQALDKVAQKLGVPLYETPTGWKYFGNLMDTNKCSICGEESFGTGADHVREKDGMWAVLAWLSILAYRNKNVPDGRSMVSVQQVVMEHWERYGRNVFVRYDYENCTLEAGEELMSHLRKKIEEHRPGDMIGGYTIDTADDFQYRDPVDDSLATGQGLRFVFKDGSRFVFRLSGTGSSGATIRLYLEKYTKDPRHFKMPARDILKDLVKAALEFSDMYRLTGRAAPTVMT